jgi:hypothetical protein
MMDAHGIDAGTSESSFRHLAAHQGVIEPFAQCSSGDTQIRARWHAERSHWL